MKNKLTLAALGVAFASVAFAQTTVYSTGFEAPFTPGVLDSQQSWLVDEDINSFFTVDAGKRTGSQGVVYDTAPAAGNNWAWLDITQAGAGNAYVTTAWVKVDEDTVNTLQSGFGLDAYGGSDAGGSNFGRIAVILVRGDKKVRFYSSTIADVPGFTPANGVWHRIDMITDYPNNRTAGAMNGSAFPITVPMPTLKSFIFDVDLLASASGFNVGHFDDYKIVRYSNANKAIAGQITYAGYMKGADTAPVTVSLYSGSTLVDTKTATPDGDGYFTVNTTAGPGTYDVYFKGSKWLSKKAGSVTLTANSPYTVAGVATVLAGDANNDDFVDFFDYLLLSASYELALGDGGYNAECDFNGDDAADFFDYLIMSDNYETNGDIAGL